MRRADDGGLERIVSLACCGIKRDSSRGKLLRFQPHKHQRARIGCSPCRCMSGLCDVWQRNEKPPRDNERLTNLRASERSEIARRKVDARLLRQTLILGSRVNRNGRGGFVRFHSLAHQRISFGKVFLASPLLLPKQSMERCH